MARTITPLLASAFLNARQWLKKNAGFTLFELLIVIAIIGVLVSLGTASYTSAQKKSRDGRRQSDLKAIQNAFEQYYADNSGSYPATCNAAGILSVTYLPSGFPRDPKSGVYYYTAGTSGGITIGNSCSASSYYFSVSLEGTATGGNATDSTCTNGAGSYFCVKSLQ